METLVIHIKNKKDSELIKKFLGQLDVEFSDDTEKLRQQLPISKFKSTEEFLSFSGSMKDQLISKEHLREISWKKRSR